MRVERIEAAAAFFASKMLAVDAHGPADFGQTVIGMGNMDDTLAHCKRIFNTAGDTRTSVCTNGDAVNNHFDRVLTTTVDRWRLIERVRFAIDTYAHVAAAAEGFPE